MQFNWDNPRLSIGVWPQATGGQFLINCLSISCKIMPILGAVDIYRLLDLSNDTITKGYYDEKLEIMLRHRPGKLGPAWHQAGGFMTSCNWLDLRPGNHFDYSIQDPKGTNFIQSQWNEARLDYREYFNQFWRKTAIDVSHSNVGFFNKAHCLSEAVGIKALIPQSKIFTVAGYSKWQDRMKIKLEQETSYLEQDVKSDSFNNIFIFEVDSLMDDQDNFLSQMRKAWDYFDFGDNMHCMSALISYRQAYLKWHANK